MTTWMFGWLVLLAVLVAIPVSMAVAKERQYRRDCRRRLAEMHRLHEWQERVARLERGELEVAKRVPSEAYRPSGTTHD